LNYVTPRNIIIGVILALLAALVLSGSYTINDRERGVILRNGKVVGVADAGWHIKAPFIDSVVEIPVTNEAMRFDKLPAYSRDSQTAAVRVSVSYHIPPSDVAEVYTKYGSVQGIESKLIARQVPTQVENVFGQYAAADAVKKRAQFGMDVAKAIRESVVGPLIIDSVQVENIDFDDKYEDNIAKMMEKEVAIATQKNDTELKKAVNEATVNQAQAEADSQVAKATANAKAIRMTGDAEAYAIEVKAKALAQNQNLVELTKAENWDGKLPTTMVPGSTVPFLNLK
jgi:regulator of protease activity HflC (stomatin/prohibitin superfamily)